MFPYVAVGVILLLSSVHGGMQFFQCDFEAGEICGLTQSMDDDFDWELGAGSTPTENTGPSFDHTLGTATGHYLYIEGSNREIGNKANIITPILEYRSAHICVRFYYHMYGAHIGALNVYIGNHGNSSDLLIWNMTSESEDEWLKADIDMHLEDGYRMTFEGIRGSNFRSDIAIDDIMVSHGLCRDMGSTLTPPLKITSADELRQVIVDTSNTETLPPNITNGLNETVLAGASETSGVYIEMSTLLIIVCCGVVFWTVVFISLCVYILRDRRKKKNDGVSQEPCDGTSNGSNNSENELETSPIDVTFANETDIIVHEAHTHENEPRTNEKTRSAKIVPGKCDGITPSVNATERETDSHTSPHINELILKFKKLEQAQTQIN
ncbi:neuropilin-1-like [Saccoglossus kowalevskii]|uniref:Neuropilin-1a-like n=1 Tax=Saccoglossus kowalevskii TaxID=10224 RepID=A0ABM0MID6_SACKO|nr:PREDICTED: neuropilin-1a-like [Saccoglossus kowalevskii]